ncbi:Heptosyltransferase III [Sterolibacterium denitrificans]|uniref:Heptosyltransferase III n=1 Tax=Sterolibacterium denitrificans TaxID=157592 RepID=A0A7Z7HNJ8_9PROT|nr:glycosyltransferase family 9 protein [Sterolibacterium denitrificans]SMB21115.1 Heptosyltransferase III [Sterolibacterium denitrificans]
MTGLTQSGTGRPEAALGRPRRILLVCTQRIGDVLLTTPLARSLKSAWPEARLDALVLPGTQGALEGNPDFAEIITLPQRVGLREKFGQLRSLWRRYDLALSPLPTDRARLFCWVAGRHRVGVLQADKARERGKALLLDQWTAFDDLDTHTVAMGLRLAELLGIPPITTVVPPSASRARLDSLLAALPSAQPCAVLHPYPKFAYKMWTPAGWIELARWLQERGHAVVLSGGPEAAERDYAQRIAARLSGPVLNLAGELSLGETTELIRTAALFVGPDTVASHIAAATGTPTLALFGPSNPVKWGPWPHDWKPLASPWQRRGSARQGNVYLLQGEDPRGCVPCMLEGCRRHVDSDSDCLLNLPASRVIAAASELLAK